MITARDLAYLATGVLIALSGLIWIVIAAVFLFAIVVTGFLAYRGDTIRKALGGGFGSVGLSAPPPPKTRQRPRAGRGSRVVTVVE